MNGQLFNNYIHCFESNSVPTLIKFAIKKVEEITKVT